MSVEKKYTVFPHGVDGVLNRRCSYSFDSQEEADRFSEFARQVEQEQKLERNWLLQFSWQEIAQFAYFDALVRKMISQRINIDMVDAYEKTALHGVVMQKNRYIDTPRRIRLLLKNNADMYSMPDMLHKVCTYGNVHMLREFFVYAKADVEKSSGEKYDHCQFMLHLLCRDGWRRDTEIFRELVHVHHANVNKPDHDGSTCLMMLSIPGQSSFYTAEDRKERREKLEFLLKHSISKKTDCELRKSVSQIRFFGCTKQRKCVYHILRHIDINAKGGETERYGTALHHAYNLQDWWFCKELLSKNARIDIPNCGGRVMSQFFL